MGPFVPDLISDQLNLVIALAIGFLFGFVLEQAGFSSSRRLVGVFYGYDLTVLRVFFTAAVTAALGVLLLGSAGLLDLRAVFVNPTWLWPAIAGGVLMGFGFLLGGYCPGTSFCGAAIGKIDAMVFSLGGLLGIYAYAEFYPRLAAFADSTALGPLQVPEWLGISPGLFVFLLASAAVLIFAVGGSIERRIAPATAPSISFPARRHAVAAASLLTVALVAALLPGRSARLQAKVMDEGYVPRHAVQSMTPDELAFRLVDRDPRTRVFDLRDEVARKAHPMPGATPVMAAAIFEKQWQPEFGPRHVQKVLVAATEDEARLSAYLLGEAGYENLAILAGGYDTFERTILSNAVGVADAGRYGPDVARFRMQAQATLLERIRIEREAPSAPRAAPKAVKGGC